MIDLRRFLTRNHSLISLMGMALAVAVIFYTVSSPRIVGVSSSQRLLPIYSVARDDKTVALSFDAAWGNEDTPELLRILAEHEVHATFFLVGGWADRYPESVRALAQGGHEVMNHSDTHPHCAQLTKEEIQAEINACSDKVEELTGVRPWLFRCPYGEYNDTTISAVSELGMTAIQWDVDSLDWKGISASEITERVLSKVRSGSIVLFHNAAEHTPEALPGIIEALQEQGYRIVPISELLLTGDYGIDHTGQQYSA